MGVVRQEYRQEALARRDLNWSVTDTRLYSEAFTGRARAIPRCHFCLQDDHTGNYCPKNPDRPWLNWLSEAPPPRSAQAPNLTTGWPARQRQLAELCRRYNEGRCRQTRCRYTHACRECGRPHPLTSCPSTSIAVPARSRSPGRSVHLPQPALRWPGPHPR